ncbi:MAG TPA: alcohol dehydrogenase catalytic domain-containing protein [Candidatus Limnocylindrales bacterium]|jgi:2-desacetyl-2-hydroxyethyl bacteriochlorophyllide A dehydrogenase
MRAVVVRGPRAGAVQDIAAPEAGEDEAVVEVAFTGICGTDYHVFDGDLGSTYPVVPGHEYSGTITAVGPTARHHTWRLGDRVAVDPVLSCGACYRCLRHQTNHCERAASPGDAMNGAFAELIRVPLANLYRVEDHETLEDAAFTEPLACAVWGIERLRPRPDDRALVFGAGPIGLLLGQLLNDRGVADVVLVDVAEAKLQVARALGAHATFTAGEALRGQLEERTGGRGFDIVVDCTGIPAVIEGLFAHAGRAARIMFFGVAPASAEIAIRPFDVYRRDWEILGSMAINGTFGQARRLLAAGRVSVSPLVSRVVGLDEVPAILGRAKLPTELKTLVAPNPR